MYLRILVLWLVLCRPNWNSLPGTIIFVSQLKVDLRYYPWILLRTVDDDDAGKLNVKYR